MNPWSIPLLNTVILLTSGATITWCHFSIVAHKRDQSIVSLFGTLLLAIVFTGCQIFEYYNAGFTISDGIYGSCFYLATGFHGFHVFIGTFYLFICLIRLVFHHFNTLHHFGFEAAAWYWHFVDVVWLFLFICIYCWGGN
jgi:cytochrome c oxidase subunit 3